MSGCFERINHIIINIIGNEPSVNRHLNKVDAYCQSSNSVIINRLSQAYGVNYKNIITYAYGEPQSYDKYKYTNNKCYFQLEKDHYYVMDINISKLDFEYFSEIDTLIDKIDAILNNNKQCPVFIFLDVHGIVRHFAEMGYFSLYKMLSKHVTNKIMLINDSCYSGGLVEIVENYERIYNSLIKYRVQYPKLPVEKTLKLYLSLFQSFASLNKTEKVIIDLISHSIDFYSELNIPNESVFDLVKLIGCKAEKISEKIQQTNILEDELIKIESTGIKSIDQVSYFFSINGFLQSEGNAGDFTYDDFLEAGKIFNREGFDMFLQLSQNNINSFLELLCHFKEQGNLSFEFPPHQNMEIITSTNSETVSMSFASIRVNDLIKIYPGSPAMGAFIKEIFLNPSEGKISYENIKKEISGESDDIEYPGRVLQKPNTHKMCEWVHLYPCHYVTPGTSFSISENLPMVQKRVVRFRIYNAAVIQELENLAKKISSCIFHKPTKDLSSLSDFVAITALLHNPDLSISDFFDIIYNYKDDFMNRPILGKNVIYTLILNSLKLSDNPTQMTALSASFLRAAVRSVSPQKEDALIPLLPNISAELASMAALCFLQEKDKISKISFYKYNKNPTPKWNDILDEIKALKENEILNFAEKYLIGCAQYALDLLNKIQSCSVDIDTMSAAVMGLRVENFLNLLIFLKDELTNEEFNAAEELVLNIIEYIVSEKNLPPHSKFVILVSLPKSVAIQAIFLSLSSDVTTRYDRVQKKLQSSLRGQKFINIKSLMDGIEDCKDKDDESLNAESKISFIKDMIIERVKKAADQFNVISNISPKRVYANTINRIQIDLIAQINQIEEVSKLYDLEPFPKINEWYNESIEMIANIRTKVQEDIIFKVSEHGFSDEMRASIPEMASNMLTNAVEEVLNLSKIIKMSEINEEVMKEAEMIPNFEKQILTLSVLSARAFNLVEIVPISRISKENIRNYRIKGPLPTPDEILALYCSCVRFELTDKDKARKRYRHKPNRKEHDKNEQEIDDYYSDDYYEEPSGPVVRESLQDMYSVKLIPILKGSKPQFEEDIAKITFDLRLPASGIKSHTKEITGFQALVARTALNIGKGFWEVDVWNAFVYQFNFRIAHLGIKFDPEKKYNGKSDDVFNRGFKAVLKFFPITRIKLLFENKEAFKGFCRENSKYSDELFHAFVQSFDDADRIVIPFYMGRKTYKPRKISNYSQIYGE